MKVLDIYLICSENNCVVRDYRSDVFALSDTNMTGLDEKVFTEVGIGRVCGVLMEKLDNKLHIV